MAGIPVRTRCLQGLKEAFCCRQQDCDDALLTWDVVTLQPISEADRKQNTVVSIIQGKESTRWVASMVQEKTLVVSVEFEIRAYQGEDYSDYLNDVMADIQRTVGEGIGLGGQSIYMRETGNSVDIGPGTQKVIGGIIFYALAYRHVAGDPTRAVGE